MQSRVEYQRARRAAQYRPALSNRIRVPLWHVDDSKTKASSLAAVAVPVAAATILPQIAGAAPVALNVPDPAGPLFGSPVSNTGPRSARVTVEAGVVAQGAPQPYGFIEDGDDAILFSATVDMEVADDIIPDVEVLEISSFEDFNNFIETGTPIAEPSIGLSLGNGGLLSNSALPGNDGAVFGDSGLLGTGGLLGDGALLNSSNNIFNNGIFDNTPTFGNTFHNQPDNAALLAEGEPFSNLPELEPSAELDAFIEAHAELLDVTRPIGASRSAARTDLSELFYESVETDQLDKFVAAAEAIAQAELYLMNEARTTPEVAEEIRIASDQLRDAIQLATDAPESSRDFFYELILWRTERLNAALSEAQPSVAVAVPRELSTEEALAAIFDQAREQAQRLEFTYGDFQNRYANGRLPAHALTWLSWDARHRLRPDAAAQLELLNEAFQVQFGTDLVVLDSYRTFAGQLSVRARGRGAIPGTSEHGWGLAVDLGGGVNRFGTAQHRWLRENAHHFGWILPDWARERGRKPEPWHWEFVGTAAMQ